MDIKANAVCKIANNTCRNCVLQNGVKFSYFLTLIVTLNYCGGSCWNVYYHVKY